MTIFEAQRLISRGFETKQRVIPVMHLSDVLGGHLSHGLLLKLI
jgi:hypothetical protein